jgi:hypothetical protein
MLKKLIIHGGKSHRGHCAGYGGRVATGIRVRIPRYVKILEGRHTSRWMEFHRIGLVKIILGFTSKLAAYMDSGPTYETRERSLSFGKEKTFE